VQTTNKMKGDLISANVSGLESIESAVKNTIFSICVNKTSVVLNQFGD